MSIARAQGDRSACAGGRKKGNRSPFPRRGPKLGTRRTGAERWPSPRTCDQPPRVSSATASERAWRRPTGSSARAFARSASDSKSSLSGEREIVVAKRLVAKRRRERDTARTTAERGRRRGLVTRRRGRRRRPRAIYRRFEEAAPDHPDAERALAWIGALYEIDREAGNDDALRGELRRTKAPALLDELRAWLWTKRRSRCFRSEGRRTRSGSGIGSLASSTMRESLSTTTRPNARSVDRRRSQEPLRLAIPQRHRGRLAALHHPRDVQAKRRRPGCVSPRCGDSRRSRRARAAVELRGRCEVARPATNERACLDGSRRVLTSDLGTVN